MKCLHCHGEGCVECLDSPPVTYYEYCFIDWRGMIDSNGNKITEELTKSRLIKIAIMNDLQYGFKEGE